MTKWEYCVVLETHKYVDGHLQRAASLFQLGNHCTPTQEGIESFLQELGQQGWELVEITTFDPTAHVCLQSPTKYVFKRPVTAPSSPGKGPTG